MGSWRGSTQSGAACSHPCLCGVVATLSLTSSWPQTPAHRGVMTVPVGHKRPRCSIPPGGQNLVAVPPAASRSCCVTHVSGSVGTDAVRDAVSPLCALLSSPPNTASPKQCHLLTQVSLSVPGLDRGSPSQLCCILWEPCEGQLPLGRLQC